MCVTKVTKPTEPAAIAKRWPTLLLIKLGRITMHRFTEALEPYGLRPRHVAALIELRDTGELPQQWLCGAMHIDPTNLVEILNQLEGAGYAVRRRDPEDRRRHLVEISDKGLAVLDEVSAVMDGVEEELLDGVDPAERDSLEAALTAIWENSGAYEAWAKVATEA